MVEVDRHAHLLHAREQVDERQLHLGQQPRATVLVDGAVERLGEVEHRPRLEHRRLLGAARGVVVLEEQLPLAGIGRTRAQLALEVAQREVGEVVGALVGTHEVGRQCGVADQPAQRPAPRGEREDRTLRVVEHLRALGVAEPARQRGVVVGGDLARVDPGRGAVGGGERERPHLTGAGTPRALDGHPGAGVAGRVGGQPGGDRTRGEPLAGEVEAALVDRLGTLAVGDLEQPGAQVTTELELVEQLEAGRAVPGRQREVGRRQLEVEVAHELVEASVAHHVGEVLAQRLTLLAGDLVGAGDDVVEAVVGVDPLRGEALADPRDAREVVGGLADQRGELGVARRRHAVLGLDRLGCHARELGDATHRVEDRAGVGHELERVAVAGEDQHLEPLGPRLGREGGDDVVGLEPLLLQVRDPQHVEHPLDQRQLGGELRGRLVATRLVVGVLLEAERLARLVEGHADVGRLLVAEHVDQHRGEAVDGIGVLALDRREVLDREREEGAVGQRVAVEQEQARGLWHARDSSRRR